MERHIRELVQVLAGFFDFPDPIWEVGSYLVPGQEDLADLRQLFPGKEYVGLDMRPGLGVDRIENIEHLNAPDESAGSILCLNTLEHVQDIYAGARELHRVLRPGGLLVVTTPFEFVIHDYPGDYWRFTPQALALLARPFPTRLLGTQGYAAQPHITFLIAFKEDRRRTLARQVPELKARLRRGLTHRRPHWDRRLRLTLARWLAGDRFFRRYDHFYDIDLWLDDETVSSLPAAGTPDVPP